MMDPTTRKLLVALRRSLGMFLALLDKILRGEEIE